MIKNNMLATHGEFFFPMVFHFRKGVMFRDFINAVERSSPKDQDESNKFKGDCLEIFAEIFFNAFSNDPSVGLMDYVPINIENDYGVDATGYNADNRQVAVQVKYRKNPLEKVKYEEISKTYTSGMIMLDLDLNHKQSIYIFTTAIESTPACKKVFENRLVEINLDIIKNYVDNNSNFWEYAFQEVYEYLNK
jgi:phage pi2 protein 07